MSNVTSCLNALCWQPARILVLALLLSSCNSDDDRYVITKVAVAKAVGAKILLTAETVKSEDSAKSRLRISVKKIPKIVFEQSSKYKPIFLPRVYILQSSIEDEYLYLDSGDEIILIFSESEAYKPLLAGPTFIYDPISLDVIGGVYRQLNK